MALRPFMTQGVVPQTLLNSFTAGNAPQGGVAMTAPMAPRMMAAPMAAGAAPAAPAATQGPDTLAQLTQLLGGDLSGSLSSGDKLLALSGLLRSATRSGRRAGITPQQVIGQLQQQKVSELQNRMAVEQLRVAEAQRRQQLQMVNEYAGAIEDPKQRAALMALGPEEAAKKISEVAFRPRQVQQIVTDDKGETKLVFGDGTTGNLDFKLERGAKWIKADPTGSGTEVLLKVDEKTGNPVLDKDGKLQTMAAGTSWADQQRIAQGAQRVQLAAAAGARAAAGGGGGGGGSKDKEAKQITVNGQTTYGIPLGGFQYRLQDGRTVTATPAAKSDVPWWMQPRPAGQGRPALNPGGR